MSALLPSGDRLPSQEHLLQINLGMQHLLAASSLGPWPGPYLTYAGLHHLHHRWNGCDPRDPERTTPLLAESLSMGPLRCLMRRHLLWWRVDVLGGVGLIGDTARKGFWLQRLDQGRASAVYGRCRRGRHPYSHAAYRSHPA